MKINFKRKSRENHGRTLKLWSKSFFKPLKQTALAACAAGLMLGASQTAAAAFLTWSDGAGNMLWDTNSLNWLNGSTPVTWNNATPDSADFAAAGAGVVNVVSNMTAGSVTFDSFGYIITNGTLTLAGPSPSITNNVPAAILSSLAGSNGLSKQGAGVLTLGDAAYTGNTLAGAGTLSIVQGTAFPSASVTVGSGALSFLGPVTNNDIIATGANTASFSGSVGGAGPRIAEGTPPTECRESW